MFNLNQRSSLASSIVTALIGWTGMLTMATIQLGYTFVWHTIMLQAGIYSLGQLVFLKGLFIPLRLNKSVRAGVLWGGLSAAGLYIATLLLTDFIFPDYLWWIVVFTSTGTAVGGFLSYFYIDDERIQLAQSFRKHVNYGRDARWLLPFVYGAGAHLLAFAPTLSANMLLVAAIVGAMVGIVAAGISHYAGDAWKFNTPLLVLSVVLAGTAMGLVTCILFFGRFIDLLYAPYLYTTAGGLLTFAFTFIKGRQLARKEMEDSL